jgi:hypothetical protein
MLCKRLAANLWSYRVHEATRPTVAAFRPGIDASLAPDEQIAAVRRRAPSGDTSPFFATASTQSQANLGRGHADASLLQPGGEGSENALQVVWDSALRPRWQQQTERHGCQLSHRAASARLFADRRAAKSAFGPMSRSQQLAS